MSFLYSTALVPPGHRVSRNDKSQGSRPTLVKQVWQHVLRRSCVPSFDVLIAAIVTVGVIVTIVSNILAAVITFVIGIVIVVTLVVVAGT